MIIIIQGASAAVKARDMTGVQRRKISLDDGFLKWDWDELRDRVGIWI